MCVLEAVDVHRSRIGILRQMDLDNRRKIYQNTVWNYEPFLTNFEFKVPKCIGGHYLTSLLFVTNDDSFLTIENDRQILKISNEFL